VADVIPTDAREAAPPTGVAAEPAFVELYAGKELSAGDAETVAIRSPVHVVVFAGAEGSGKTTVLASIYERLSQGPLAGFQFGGSRSLLGFEQICYLNRLASGGVRPDTPRTVPTDEVAYYHLALKGIQEGGAGVHHVLLSAVSGELFRLARNSREDCERLTFLRRADAIVVLIDGARLAVPDQRTNAQADASGILESFLDAGMVTANCRIDLVFSKLDRIIATGESAIEFLKKTQEKLEVKFRTRVPSLAFRQIAARPDPSLSNADLKDGLAEAFASWMAPKPPDATNPWMQVAPPSDTREFSKFGWRHFDQVRRDKP
jgi:hypothetical protein